MDMRYDMRGDGRRFPPRNARGEFTRRGRGRRMDRGMDYGYDMARGENRGGRGRGRNDYGDYEMRNGDMRGMDGHHYPMHGGRSGGYEPVEFMGYCNGYYGSPEQDYGRGDYRGRDMGYRNYDMRGGRDYGYDYGYGDYGDYGETLSEKELEHWNKKLMEKVEDKYKGFFTKENVAQRARQHGFQMKDFGENELLTATLMQYTDLCKYLKPFVGENLDAYIGAGYGFLVDDDTEVKGAEKLTQYYDDFVQGKD